jgi:hypothetical protein
MFYDKLIILHLCHFSVGVFKLLQNETGVLLVRTKRIFECIWLSKCELFFLIFNFKNFILNFFATLN